jgi:hypothetical protein
MLGDYVRKPGDKPTAGINADAANEIEGPFMPVGNLRLIR